MYEELLIGDNPESTKHSRIMRAREKRLEWAELAVGLDQMSRSLEEGDAVGALAVVRRIVPDYKPAAPAADDEEDFVENTSQNRYVG